MDIDLKDNLYRMRENLISQDDIKIITVLDMFPVPLFHADTLKIRKILIFQNIFLKSCNTL